MRQATRGEYVANLVNDLVGLLIIHTANGGDLCEGDKAAYMQVLRDLAAVLDGGPVPDDALPLAPPEAKS